MNILLADDHAMLRSGLRRIILDAHPTTTIGEAGDSKELLDRLRATNWSVLVLDIALGDRNGLDIIPAVQQLCPQIRIVILSMYSEHQFVTRALRSGASAYVTKDRAPEELLKAIQSVLDGKRYLSEDVARRLADCVAVADIGSTVPHEQLSVREYEVFLLLASAQTISQIATRLNLSVKTISTYRSRILEKTGLSSNAEVMRYALQHGLTP